MRTGNISLTTFNVGVIDESPTRDIYSIRRRNRSLIAEARGVNGQKIICFVNLESAGFSPYLLRTGGEPGLDDEQQ